MSSSEEDRASRAKLAKLVAAFDADLSEECVEMILKMEGDINYNAITSGSALNHLRRLPEIKIPKMTKLLFEYGIDVTLKNNKGHTVLHEELAQQKYADTWRFASSFDRPLVESILSAHVDRSIRQNPCDDNGISHFHIACMTGHQRAVEFFLNNGVNVDKAINTTSPIFPDCSPLHLSVRGGRLETTKKLLQHGANVGWKDAKGSTVVRALVERNLSLMNWEVDGSNSDLIEEYEANQRMIRLLLTSSADADNNNNSTIRLDEHGFTNFHAACACDDLSLVENMLVRLDDVNQTVHVDSPLWPGYTPLHFAAHFSADIVKLLFANGGDLEVKDANGLTPLDIILQRHRVDDVHDLLAAHPSWRNILMTDKRTKLLDLFDAMRSEVTFKWFLDGQEDAKDLRVGENSPLWPSYSILHFAVMFSERVSAKFHELRAGDESFVEDEFLLSTWLVDELFNRGVDDVARQGTRASIHLSFYSQKELCVDYALDHLDKDKANDFVDDNDLSLLHIVCASFDYLDLVIHKLVEHAIDTGANVNLPMASSIGRLDCLSYHPGADSPLTRFFIVAGSTPLHMAVTAHHTEKAKLLLRRGADVNATNVEGWSPLHTLALMTSGSVVGKAVLTFTAKLRERVVEAVGLTHLHVACHVGSLRGAKKLIKLGSDVNAVLRFDSTPRSYNYAGCSNALDVLRQTDYAGFTPLHFAVRSGSLEIATVLLEADADVLARNAKGELLLHEILRKNEELVDLFVDHLRGDESLQERLKQDSGVTMLHVLAFRMDVEEVEAAVDVNVKVKEDSSIWPGYTALHVWMEGAKDCDLADDDVRKTLQLLLDAGADVTIPDKMLDTPLHLFDRWFGEIDDEITLSIGRLLLRLLLRSQKDFSVNPTNASGISHFHIAVRMHELGIVEKFLEHGVDVNQQVDVLSNSKPGCSALHLLAYGESTYMDGLTSRMQTIDLLLRHGADVRARDVLGNTPLHALTKNEILQKELFDMIVQKARGTLNSVNIAGETPFAVALKSTEASAKEVEFFLKYGCRVNAYNGVDDTGMLASVFVPSDRSIEQLNDLYQALFRKPAVNFVDESGRTAIHNVVSSRAKTIVYEEFLIEKLVDFGLDIDAQDRSGKTALHTAAMFKNERGVSALLVHGADVNVLDSDGKTAFDYALDACSCSEQGEVHYHEDVIRSIWIHVKRLRLLKFDVNERNENLYIKAQEDRVIDVSVSNFFNQVKSTKNVKVIKPDEFEDSLRVHDFLSETGAVAAYWTMSRAKRRVISKFSMGPQLKSVGEVWGLLKLQYRKAVKRTNLIEKAFKSLWILSGIRVPELCCECLLGYLSLRDVQSLIAATQK